MIAIFSCCLTVALNRPIYNKAVIASIVLLVLIGVLIIPIGGLFGFHLVLISNGRTTNEHVTGKYKGMDFFTRGAFKNFMHLFCGSLSPRFRPVKTRRLKKVKSRETSAPNSLIKKNSLDLLGIEANRASLIGNRGSLSGESVNGDSGQESDLADMKLKNKKPYNKHDRKSLSDSASMLPNNSSQVSAVQTNETIRMTNSPAKTAILLANNSASIDANSTIRSSKFTT